MSIVPKYRAWYKPLGQMIQPDRLEHINFEVKVLGVYIKMEDRGFHKLRMSDFELMQYTGVHDDGDDEEEICDGDIVELQYENEAHICKIKREGCGFMFVADSLPDGFLWMTEVLECDRNYWWVEGTRKVGNIYENPELIEV
ncbi:YopX family protein [Paenibacillus sp. RS8]|uniref:YopX family protein n=1 Tax=Paenibacillus sp. RS8 TaxID=3242681 RepID=UPI0035C11E5A